MGHVQRLGDKRYRARYRGPDGRERSKVFRRKLDADRWLATQSADVARGAWVDPTLGRMTLEEWSKRWESGLHDLRPTTLELNLGVVRNHLLPRFGDWQLAQISTADVKAMVADDLSAGASTSSVRRRVLVLRSVLAGAVAEGRLARNPCDGVKLPPERTRKMRVLDADQVHALAEAFPVHYQPLIYTAAYVGLRWGELAGLRVGKVDPLRRTIVVDEQLVDVNGVQHFGPPKTRAGVRTVTMPAAVAELLAVHMGTDPVRASGLVFPTVTGQPMRRGNFRTLWVKRVDEVLAGTALAGLVFHELRHTAASLAIAEGAHPMTVKERLGHSSITVTIDRYGHMFPAQDQALAEALDQTFRESRAARSRHEAASVGRLRRSGADHA